jgi:hypothetical protein
MLRINSVRDLSELHHYRFVRKLDKTGFID